MNILITGVGSPTPRGIARSLKENILLNREYKLYGTDIDRYAHGLYNNDIFEKTFLTKSCLNDEYWNEITDIIKKNNIDIAIITPEKEVIEWSKKQEYGILPCKALIPHKKIIDFTYDKLDLSRHLLHTTWVPKFFEILPEKLNEYKSIISSELNYPFWIRATSGTSGFGSYKVESFDDLERWITINKNIKKYIASDFLPGRNLVCKLLYYKGELLRAACGERVEYIMAQVSPSGITGNTSYGKVTIDKLALDVSIKAMDFLFKKSNSEKHGMFSVDLKEDYSGVPKITEVNIRHVAFNQIFAILGANLNEDAIRLLTNDPSFDSSFTHYTFKDDYIFLRDVDERPIVIKKEELL